MRKKLFAMAVSSLLLLAGMAYAQSRNGTIRGVVRDSSRNVIPGVQVALLDPETKASTRTVTNESGEYRFDVKPGAYELYAYLPGFSLLKGPDVKLNENETIQKELTLTIDTNPLFQLLGR